MAGLSSGPIRTALDVPPDELEAPDRAVLEDVARHGFHWISVTMTDEDLEAQPDWHDVPDWSYTIGLYRSYGHPELVAFDLDEEAAGSVFWDLATGIEGGRTFTEGSPYDDALPSFEGQRCAFETVSPLWIPALFGYGQWFYLGRDFPVMQYVWPDRAGHFVWEEEAATSIRETQPDLRSPPAYDGEPPPRRP